MTRRGKVCGTFLGFPVVFKSYFCTFFAIVVVYVAWKTCNCFSKQFMSFSQQLNFYFCALDNHGQLFNLFFKAIPVLFTKWKYVNYCNHFFPSHLADLNEFHFVFGVESCEGWQIRLDKREKVKIKLIL